MYSIKINFLVFANFSTLTGGPALAAWGSRGLLCLLVGVAGSGVATGVVAAAPATVRPAVVVAAAHVAVVQGRLCDLVWYCRREAALYALLPLSLGLRIGQYFSLGALYCSTVSTFMLPIVCT
jgi:hypothetical protein